MKAFRLLLAAAFAVSGAQAAESTGTGTVALISVQDSTVTTGDYITVNNLANPGSCQTKGNRVILVVKDDSHGNRMMSIATAALLAGKDVTVKVDNTKVVPNTTYCYLQYITIAP